MVKFARANGDDALVDAAVEALDTEQLGSSTWQGAGADHDGVGGGARSICTQRWVWSLPITASRRVGKPMAPSFETISLPVT